MPDISKCKGENCPIRKQCYRHTVKDSEFMQAYAPFKYDLEKEKCDAFVPNKKDKADEKCHSS